MLLEFFLSVFAVSIILLLLGKFIDVSYGYIGGGFLFILGLSIMFSPIQLYITDNVSISYDYINENSTHLNLTTEVHTPQYQTFDEVLHTGATFNHVFGFFIMAVGLASILIMALTRNKR